MARILMVDDSKTSRRILREILTDSGHEVVGEACNGEEGYLMFKELRPDLVTMDIAMPKMDGIESLMLIRGEDENAKVIMITASGQKENMMKAIKYGVAEFITKPYDADEVVRLVNKVLTR